MKRPRGPKYYRGISRHSQQIRSGSRAGGVQDSQCNGQDRAGRNNRPQRSLKEAGRYLRPELQAIPNSKDKQRHNNAYT